MSPTLSRVLGRPRTSEVVVFLSGIVMFASAMVVYGVYCAVCEVPAAVFSP